MQDQDYPEYIHNMNDQPITKRELTETQRLNWAAWGISVLLIVAGAYLGIRFPDLPPVPIAEQQSREGFQSSFTGLVIDIPTTVATATPGVIVNNLGVGRAIEIQDAGTPVWAVNNGGSVSRTGNDSVTGDLSVTGSGRIAAPTAAATATPALVVDSLAAGARIFDVRDSATPVWSVYNGGGVYGTGSHIIANAFQIASPAQGTATPVALINSNAGSQNILEVRDAATPVFTVRDGGTVVGNVLQYGSAGQRAVAWSSTAITTTATVAHGLTTVTWAVCTLAQDPHTDGGDAATVSVAIAGNVVTVKAWQDDATAATETDVAANCLVIGTP